MNPSNAGTYAEEPKDVSIKVQEQCSEEPVSAGVQRMSIEDDAHPAWGPNADEFLAKERMSPEEYWETSQKEGAIQWQITLESMKEEALRSKMLIMKLQKDLDEMRAAHAFNRQVSSPSIYQKDLTEQIPMFGSSKMSMMEIIAWELKMRRFISFSKLSDPEKSDLMVSRLKDQALISWQAYCTALCLTSVEICSTIKPLEILDGIIKRSLPKDVDHKAHILLFKLKMDVHKPILDFHHQFSLLCRLAASMSPSTQKVVYLEAIPEVLKKEILSKNITELQDMMEYVRLNHGDSDLKQTLRLTGEHEKEKGKAFYTSFAKNAHRTNKPLKCFNCGKLGHISPDCRIKKRNVSPSTSSASSSKSSGTGKRKAPTKKNPQVCLEEFSNLVCDETNVSNKFIKIHDESDINFIIDSGASCHMLASCDVIPDANAERVDVTVADGNTVDGFKVPNISFDVLNNTNDDVHSFNNKSLITLTNPIVVPELQKNLFSINVANKQGYDVTCLKSGEVVISKDGEDVITTPPTSENIRILKLKQNNFASCFTASTDIFDDDKNIETALTTDVSNKELTKMHEMLGHPGN